MIYSSKSRHHLRDFVSLHLAFTVGKQCHLASNPEQGEHYFLELRLNLKSVKLGVNGTIDQVLEWLSNRCPAGHSLKNLIISAPDNLVPN